MVHHKNATLVLATLVIGAAVRVQASDPSGGFNAFAQKMSACPEGIRSYLPSYAVVRGGVFGAGTGAVLKATVKMDSPWTQVVPVGAAVGASVSWLYNFKAEHDALVKHYTTTKPRTDDLESRLHLLTEELNSLKGNTLLQVNSLNHLGKTTEEKKG